MPIFYSTKSVFGKWSILIMHNLDDGALRFGELQRKISDITQATLTKQFRNSTKGGIFTNWFRKRIQTSIRTV